jgi:hypothetical protein
LPETHIRSTPTEMQSINENDFECFASTGVNTPETMFPNSGALLTKESHKPNYQSVPLLYESRAD